MVLLGALGVVGCKPSQSEIDAMQSRMAALEEQQLALQSQLEAVRADQTSIARESDTAAIERRRVRGVADDLSGRVALLEEATAKPEPTARPGRPDPTLRYRATVDDAHTKGPADALVTIVMFEDFQCPFCSRAANTMKEVESRYGRDVRLVFKHNPLPMHPQAKSAAIAAEAAGRQGKFWEMHDLLFKNQRALSDAQYLKFAKKLGLRRKRFKRDLADPTLAAKVDKQQKQANALGARGTPAFFINGRFLSGAQPLESFAKTIDAELDEARRRVRDGTRKAAVYDALMAEARSEV